MERQSRLERGASPPASEEESVLGYAPSVFYSDPSPQKQYRPVDHEALLEYPEVHADVPNEWFSNLREFIRSFTYPYYLLLREVAEEFETLGCAHYVHCQELVASREELYQSRRAFISVKQITKLVLLHRYTSGSQKHGGAEEQASPYELSDFQRPCL